MVDRGSRARLLATLLLTVFVGCSEPLTPPDPVPVADRPNIVLIISDDHGYSDFGFMGSEHVQTPSLDRLAASGTTFVNGYSTASVGGPALRSLMTGLHPEQSDALVRRRLDESESESGLATDVSTNLETETLPRALARSGYASFQTGKFWELDDSSSGFTHGKRTLGDSKMLGQRRIEPVGRETMQPVYDFIETRGDEPFLLWFAPELPHAPFNARVRYRKPYRGKGYVPLAAKYYANISWLDDVVGQLLGFLDERGLRERTLVVLVSDNGWDQPPDSQAEAGAGSNLDGPRGKGSMHELGFRTPIVVSWPGHVLAGRRSDALVSIVDLFPTFLEYVGAPAVEGRPGKSLRSLLEGRSEWPRPALFGSMRNPRHNGQSPEGRRELRLVRRLQRHPDDELPNDRAYFARTADWHYIWFGESKSEALYSISSDPREDSDVAHVHPEVAADLRNRIVQWRGRMLRPPINGGDGG